jgi:hypothetical protein
MRRALVLGLVAAISGIGCDSGGRGNPGGTRRSGGSPDTGNPIIPIDGGFLDGSPVDGGFVDTGVGPFDSGLPPRDAGPITDTGLPPFDSGVPPFDSGVPSFDSGVPPVDAGFPPTDAGFPPVDAGFPPTDAGFPADAGPPGNASAAIQAVRNAPSGATLIPIQGAIVTYLKPLLGNDPAGFFVQAERLGPAVFVRVDPATLSPQPTPGRLVSFDAMERSTDGSGVVEVRQIANWRDLGPSPLSLAQLEQDVSFAPDLVSNLLAYESELVRADVMLSAGMIGAGQQHYAARADTVVVAGSPNLELRLPESLQDQYGFGIGCTLGVRGTPLWQFQGKVQLSAYRATELQLGSCPAPQLVSATPNGSRRVRIAFDRPIAASSVPANGAGFVISPSLAVFSATVNDNQILLDTADASPGVSYSITVPASLRDRQGQALSGNRVVGWVGPPISARVRINELNANIDGGCDLIELRVIEGGSLDGWTLQWRTGTLVNFSGLTLQRNDFIVVHLNSGSATCNPGFATNETSSPSAQPRSLHAQNFDTAYDWYSTNTGLQRTDGVALLYDAGSNLVDAALFSDDATGTAARDSELAAEAAALVLEWTDPSGRVPSGGFIDALFSANAVLDLDATAVTPVGTSIQRSDDTDTNHRVGWTDQNLATWGRENPGQSRL